MALNSTQERQIKVVSPFAGAKAAPASLCPLAAALRKTMYEHKNKPLISRQHFRKRMLNHVLLALTLVVLSLSVGVAGHIYFDDMSFITALVASTTLMSGQGLSVLPESITRQLFASLYGILCGYVYVATSSIIIAPVLHRVFHKFHLDDDD